MTMIVLLVTSSVTKHILCILKVNRTKACELRNKYNFTECHFTIQIDEQNNIKSRACMQLKRGIFRGMRTYA